MILLIVFINMSIACMEPETSPLYSMVLLSEDIVPNAIVPFLSLQSLGRFKQVSQLSNQLYNIVSACHLLENDYYACTKALAHCAEVGDKVMFKHWWSYHAKARDNDLSLVLNYKDLTLETRMEAYRKHYSTEEKTKKAIVMDVRCGIDREDSDGVKTVLSGNGIHVFDEIPKEYIFFGKPQFEIDMMLSEACRLNDPLVVEALCGGVVSSKLFRTIVIYGTSHIIAGLINSGALPIDTVDSDKKTLLHYVAQYNFHEIIALLIAKGLLVDCVDTRKKTPLHYATEYRHVYAVMALLDGNANMSLRDRWGRTPLDYVKRAGLVPSNDSEDRHTIKTLLLAHRNKLNTSRRKKDKMSKKGYSKIE